MACVKKFQEGVFDRQVETGSKRFDDEIAEYNSTLSYLLIG